MKKMLLFKVFLISFLCLVIGVGLEAQHIYQGKSWKRALPEKTPYTGEVLPGRPTSSFS